MKVALKFLFLSAGIFAFVAASPIAKDFVGTWTYTVADTPNGDYEGELIIEKDGDAYSGHMAGEGGKLDLQNVRVEDGTLKFSINVDGYDCSVSLGMEGEELKGSVYVEGESFPMKGKKKA